MSHSLFILHFLPIEGYPPILNLLDYLSNEKKIQKIFCSTTKGNFSNLYKNDVIKVARLGNISGNKFSLWSTYFFFNLSTILRLVITRPKNVLYYETISSYPAYFYKKYINRKANLFIHYHEYVTEQEYAKGSFVNKFYHQLEQKIYAKAKWISHTNEVRLNKFLKDNSIENNVNKHHIFPNYPSKNWAKQNIQWPGNGILNLIFVGYSVDPKGCYIVELIEWLQQQKQETVLDIYCIKQNSLPKKYIGLHGNTTVNVHKAIPYHQLPEILKNYHVGLILYKGLTPNYIYNAPNKLFEYLACGLDVWFPNEMDGCFAYETKNTYPKVIKLNFAQLNPYNIMDLIAKENANFSPSNYICEHIYINLMNEIIS